MTFALGFMGMATKKKIFQLLNFNFNETTRHI